MTQMGLEYAKLLEQRRHNLADEDIRDTGNVISKQEADTKQYVASFKPREVDIEQHKADSSRLSAQASQRQAGVAERKQSLDEQYRERETQVKEKQAAASAKQADVAHKKYELDEDYRERETAAKELQASAASETASSKTRAQDLAELKNVVDRLPESVRSAWAAGNIPKKMDFGNPWYAAIAGVYNKWTGSLPSSKDIVNLIKFLG